MSISILFITPDNKNPVKTVAVDTTTTIKTIYNNNAPDYLGSYEKNKEKDTLDIYIYYNNVEFRVPSTDYEININNLISKFNFSSNNYKIKFDIAPPTKDIFVSCNLPNFVNKQITIAKTDTISTIWNKCGPDNKYDIKTMITTSIKADMYSSIDINPTEYNTSIQSLFDSKFNQSVDAKKPNRNWKYISDKPIHTFTFTPKNYKIYTPFL